MSELLVLEKARRILEQPVCDNCLGRQFGQLLSGFTNKERGQLLRTAVAMSIDKEETEKGMDLSNFHEFKFRHLEIKEKPKAKTCTVCGGLFENLEKFADKIAKKAKGVEFKTFLVGTKLPFDLIAREEALWERVGIDWCEPLKAELNREIGKLAEKKTKAKFSKTPDVNFIIDIETGKVNAEINPLFVYGEYQKLKRGIPQTKWPSGKYKTSVEQIIARPFMAATQGKAHKLHGQGREDIDARCLAWRPFVLEIIGPKKRIFDFAKAARKIGKGVRIRKPRLSNISEVRKIKEMKVDKTYRAIVACKSKIAASELKKLRQLVEISQKTPQRVLHRRADRYRTRRVRSLSFRRLGPKKFLLTVRAEAGLYIKELISGDNGRTKPSVSELLGNECRCKELDVVKIHV